MTRTLIARFSKRFNNKTCPIYTLCRQAGEYIKMEDALYQEGQISIIMWTKNHIKSGFTVCTSKGKFPFIRQTNNPESTWKMI